MSARGMRRASGSGESRLANWEITVLALWRLGGSFERQSTEDVAVEAWKLAPQRFSWQKYPEHPNMDTARVALTDAKKAKNGSLVDGDNKRRGEKAEKTGWLLTPAGVARAKEYETLRSGEMAGRGAKLRRADSEALDQLRKHVVFVEWQAGRTLIQYPQIADVVNLPADAPKQVTRRRLIELVNAAKAADDSSVGGFLKWLLSELVN